MFSVIPDRDEEPNEYTYDPYRYGKKHKATSFWGTVFHMSIVSAGSAIFNVPKSLASVDYTVGFVGIFFIVFLYAYNMHIFVSSEYEMCKRRRVPNLSYPDTVYYAFKDGPRVLKPLAAPCQYMIRIIFLLVWIGTNAFNLILMANFVQLAATMIWDYQLTVRMSMLILFAPLLVLSWIPNLKYLTPLSMAGSIINIIVILFIGFDIIAKPNVPPPVSQKLTVTNISGFFGSVLFCLNATGMIMPLKNDMKYPGKFNSTWGVLTISYIIISLVLGAFSYLCALKFGSDLKEIVIMNLPEEQAMSKVIFLLFAFSVYFSFPVTSYVVFDTLREIVEREAPSGKVSEFVWEYGFRTLVFVMIFGLAFLIPNISVLLSATGTVCTSIDSILFPVAVNTLQHWYSRKEHGMRVSVALKNGAIAILAIILMGFGLYDCVIQISEYYTL